MESTWLGGSSPGGPARALNLLDTAPRSRASPSVTVLFESIARTYGSSAVDLTGMGDDGAAGLGEIKQAGGFTIAQDEADLNCLWHARCRDQHGHRRWYPPKRIGAMSAGLAALPRQG